MRVKDLAELMREGGVFDSFEKFRLSVPVLVQYTGYPLSQSPRYEGSGTSTFQMNESIKDQRQDLTVVRYQPQDLLYHPIEKREDNAFTSLIFLGRTNKHDIQIDHASISRLHLVFTHDGEGFQVKDDCSSNGTWLNDIKMAPRSNYPLRDGDLLILGGHDKVELRYFSSEIFYERLKDGKL